MIPVYKADGNYVAPRHGHTAPIVIGVINSGVAEGLEIKSLLTHLEDTIVSVHPDGTVTIAISDRALQSTLREMQEG